MPNIIVNKLKQAWSDEEGWTVTEYAIMGIAILAAVGAVIGTFRTNIQNTLQAAADAITNTAGAAGGGAAP